MLVIRGWKELICMMLAVQGGKGSLVGVFGDIVVI
jgi:hypothetical protein